MIDLLVVVRDIHFASSVIVAGIVFFDLLVAVPVLAADLRLSATASSFRETTQKILWAFLSVSLASALAWLCLLSARIAALPFAEVLANGTIWIVASRTQFGLAWMMRVLFAVLLAASLLARWRVKAGAASWQVVLPALLAGCYLGSLAFGGHGEEGLGLGRTVHLAADFVHLLAAGLWLGGLVPLAILLTYLRRSREEPWARAACNAGSRFSTLGILAVGTLLISGTVNASFLVGEIRNLTDTPYGRLFLLKIALFAAMVLIATFNRLHLLPRLCSGRGADRDIPTLRLLVRSTLAEISLGLAIIMVVGILGITPPAVDMASHVH